MNQWTIDELSAIAKADELQLSTMRPDGTLRNPVTIWVVTVDNAVYIRAINGREGAWFQRALDQHNGHVDVGGVSRNVTISEPPSELSASIDAVYRTKYERYGERILGTTLVPQAQAATLRLEPTAT